MATHYCEKCGKTMDEKEFYKSKNISKYPPDGVMNTCKKCMTMHVDNWDPETYKWILQEVDVPYIKEEWDSVLEKYGQDASKVTGLTIIGRYLSKMKLKQWKIYTWADTERLEQESKEKKIQAMKAQGMSGEEIDEQLAIDRTPPKPHQIAAAGSPVGIPDFMDFEEEDDFTDSLTEEDKIMLRLKWGRGYRPEEWVRLEQLYNDMEASYDIQGAGMKDTLIMICKASLKANQLIDVGDIEGFQKMTKVYNDLMKSAKLTAAQIKADSGEFIDSIGELVAICEKEGFIPRFYIDKPNDKVDETLQDLQHYTQTLINEETNLSNMIDGAVRQIVQDKERENRIALDDTDDIDENSGIMDYSEDTELTYEDYEEFENMIQADQEVDNNGAS